MSNEFPDNPVPGEMIEVQPGQYFVYSAVSNAWTELEGNANPPLATPLIAGLMTSADYVKLNEMILPPPQTTLKSEDYDAKFASGVITLSTADQTISDGKTGAFLNVDGKAKLMNVAAGIDGDTAEEVARNLHHQAYSFDVALDVANIYEYLVANNKFRVITKEGKQGIKGLPGESGDNLLKHGPDGLPGLPGANAVIPVGLAADPIPYAKRTKDRRAIIDISTEEINEDENYLVVTRAVIGNPDAAPDKVKISSLTNSKWVAVIPSDLTKSNTRDATTCSIYNGQVYYLDLEPILQSIKNEYLREVEILRDGIERVVSWWLNVMSGKFDEQKAALCCALEYCQSRTRNAELRKHIETTRINAAGFGGQVILEPNPRESTAVDLATTIMQTVCGTGFGSSNRDGLPTNADPVGASHCVPVLTIVNGRPYKYNECPAGFTPRSVYRESRLNHFSSSSVEAANFEAESMAALSVPPKQVGSKIAIKNDEGSIELFRPLDLLRKSNNRILNLDSSDPEQADLLRVVRTMGAPQEVIDKSSVELQAICTKDADISIHLVSEFGDIPTGSGILRRQYNAKTGHQIYRYNEEILPSIQHLCVINRGAPTGPFKLVLATQNGVMTQGIGAGWKAEFINNSKFVDGDYALAGGTLLEHDGLDTDQKFWLRLKVLADPALPESYVAECGAVGPRISPIDTRACAELPMSMGNPLLREVRTEGRGGIIQDWNTSNFGSKPVPDAIGGKIGGRFSTLGNLVLCRVSGGSYTGGFSHARRSCHITIEQESPLNLAKTSPLRPKQLASSIEAVGSLTFRCTLLVWGDSNCQGAADEFSTVVSTTSKDEFGLKGVWNLNDGQTVPFEFVGVPNDSTLLDLHDNIGYTVVIDPKNQDFTKLMTIDLPRGSYVAAITDCCLKVGSQYTGYVKITHRDANGPVVRTMPDYGLLDDQEQATSLYKGMTTQISHIGGQVSVELGQPLFGDTSGSISVTFTKTDLAHAAVVEEAIVVDCVLHYKELDYLKSLWSSGKCSGLVVDIKGQDYIIITADSVSCLNQTTAIAWPTFNGTDMVAVPKSGSVPFKIDETLSQAFSDDKASGRYISPVGNYHAIETVLFPAI